jgi:eukaryotic-like serine/threonine-protein kinase
MDVEPAAEQPSTLAFDDFRLVRALGKGGMGTVWLGHDTVLDRPVALKFLSDPSGRGRARLLSEARALARIHHPNVAAVYRVGEVDGQPYIAYEYIDGASLAGAALPLPWRTVLEIALGLARGLAAVHRQGVLHCDIKPANIVLTRGGEPKLIDFGIARVRRCAEPEPAPGEPLRAPIGPRGRSELAIGGTPLYMAPELWQGQPFSEATDLYALGLVLHELLAGPVPQQQLAGDAMISFLATREVAHLGSLVGTIPAAFADLVARLTGAQPTERSRSADALADALEVLRSLYRGFVANHDAVADADDQSRLVAHLDSLGERRGELGRRFYDSLFTNHPDLRPLFPAEMTGQQRKLEDALELVVHRLNSSETLVPLLEDLGRRHADYGVKPEHFETVGHQLLATLEELSGPTWTDDLRRTWAHAYDRIAHVMVRGLDRARTQVAATRDLVPPTEWDLPIGPPATRYARNGPVSLAYQVVGAGPLHLVLVPDFVSHLEVGWELPAHAAFLRRLSSFATVIIIDKRGTGLSDRVLDALSLDEQIADLDAVLDEVGVDRAAIVGLATGGALASAYAAMRPDRTRALVLYGAAARLLQAPNYPHGHTPERFAAELAQIQTAWGQPLFLEQRAPSLADDPALRAWWARYLRASASPGAAQAVLSRLASLDLRAIYPAIRTPTLVIARSDDAVAPIAGARLVAAQIEGARLCELAGADHLPFVGDSDAVVSEIHRFLAAMPEPTGAGGHLLTTLAVAAHDAFAVAIARALFAGVVAGAAVAVDREAMTAELGPTAPVSVAARALRTAATLRGLPISVAVITALQPTADLSAQLELTLALARATPPGRLGMSLMARELSRGAKPLPGEVNPPT